MESLTKIDKEVLITAITIFIAVLLVLCMLYKYLSGSAVKVQNSTGGAQTEIKAIK